MNEDLINKLKSTIMNIEEIRNLKFNKIAHPYDWSTMIKTYDQLLCSITK